MDVRIRSIFMALPRGKAIFFCVRAAAQLHPSEEEMSGKIVIDENTMMRTLARLSHEIIERHPDETEIYLVGIRRRGVPLSAILKKNIEKFSDLKVFSGELDITLYRDDLKADTERYREPSLRSTEIPFDVNGHRIILVDDVIFTGRTARAAMEAIISLGRPASIELCVMVDRGHRELPISANYVGKNIPTSRHEFVSVCVEEFDGCTRVELYDPAEAAGKHRNA